MPATATVLDRPATPAVPPGLAAPPVTPPAPMLRLLRAPVTDPPYDDEREGDLPPCVDAGTLLELPLEPPRTTVARLRPVPGAAGGTPPTTPRATGDPRPRALALVRALLEVLAGTRPLRHLTPVTSPAVMAALERSLGRPRSSRRPVVHRTLRSVRVAIPTPGVAEVSAVLQRGDRCTALAMRIVALEDRWVVTDLTLG